VMREMCSSVRVIFVFCVPNAHRGKHYSHHKLQVGTHIHASLELQMYSQSACVCEHQSIRCACCAQTPRRQTSLASPTPRFRPVRRQREKQRARERVKLSKFPCMHRDSERDSCVIDIPTLRERMTVSSITYALGDTASTERNAQVHVQQQFESVFIHAHQSVYIDTHIPIHTYRTVGTDDGTLFAVEARHCIIAICRKRAALYIIELGCAHYARICRRVESSTHQ